MSMTADLHEQVREAVAEYRKEHGGKFPPVGHVFILEDVRTYLVCEADILPDTVEIMYDGRFGLARVTRRRPADGHVDLEWETPDGTRDRCLCTVAALLKAVEKREAVSV